MDEQQIILCVDDEAPILRSLERSLRLEGYKVLTAPGGEEALEVLQKDRVDLMIVDQRMPGMKGSELLKIVREKYPSVVRIMASGYSDFSSLVDAVNQGEIFRFVAKPWNDDELKEVIRLGLERREK